MVLFLTIVQMELNFESVVRWLIAALRFVQDKLRIYVEDDIVEGLEEAICSMRKGEICTFTIDPMLGFGSAGDEKLGIPPNAFLEYEVELLELERLCDQWELSIAQKIEFAQFRKKQGNNHFKEGRFERAEHRYEQALEQVRYEKSIEEEDLKSAADTIRMQCFANMSAIKFKAQEYGTCVAWCSKALQIDPDNKKVLFRRGSCYISTGEPDLAVIDLQRGLDLYPEDNIWTPLLQKAQRNIAMSQKAQKNAFGGWCSRGSVSMNRDDPQSNE